MIGLTPDITNVTVVRNGVLRLTFTDGLTGELDVLDRMSAGAWPDQSKRQRRRAGGSLSGLRRAVAASGSPRSVRTNQANSSRVASREQFASSQAT
jgi:hypothetical protein